MLVALRARHRRRRSLGGLLLAIPLIMGFAAAMACWGCIIALRFGTQQAAPLMQMVAFASILLTTAYAPERRC